MVSLFQILIQKRRETRLISPILPIPNKCSLIIESIDGQCEARKSHRRSTLTPSCKAGLSKVACRPDQILLKVYDNSLELGWRERRPICLWRCFMNNVFRIAFPMSVPCARNLSELAMPGSALGLQYESSSGRYCNTYTAFVHCCCHPLLNSRISVSSTA